MMTAGSVHRQAPLPERLTTTDTAWGYYCADGNVWHANAFSEWEGREGARELDTVGMLLDFTNGAFLIYKNGTQVRVFPWNCMPAFLHTFP